MPVLKHYPIFRRSLLLLIFLSSGLLLPSSIHLEFCVSFTGWNLAVTVADCLENQHTEDSKSVDTVGECTDGEHLPLGCGRSQLDLCQAKSLNSLQNRIPLPRFDGSPFFSPCFRQKILYCECSYSYSYSFPPPDKLLQLRSIVIRC